MEVALPQDSKVQGVLAAPRIYSKTEQAFLVWPHAEAEITRVVCTTVYSTYMDLKNSINSSREGIPTEGSCVIQSSRCKQK